MRRKRAVGEAAAFNRPSAKALQGLIQSWWMNA
jgi:hypothetical protein